jgi:hypothetical protein
MISLGGGSSPAVVGARVAGPRHLALAAASSSTFRPGHVVASVWSWLPHMSQTGRLSGHRLLSCPSCRHLMQINGTQYRCALPPVPPPPFPPWLRRRSPPPGDAATISSPSAPSTAWRRVYVLPVTLLRTTSSPSPLLAVTACRPPSSTAPPGDGGGGGEAAVPAVAVAVEDRPAELRRRCDCWNCRCRASLGDHIPARQPL